MVIAREQRLLVAILAAVFVLRLGVAWRLPSIHQADEIYQVAEQANRAVHGYGIVSWEFQNQSRGALFPAIVKPFFLLDVSPAAHQMLIAALFSALSLIPVWVAFAWTRELFGVAEGVLASLMMATWFELAYFAPKPTPDAVGGYFLLAALFLARPRAPAPSMFFAGFTLALALGVRMQIAPAVGLVFVYALVTHGRARALPLVAGSAAAVVFAGAIEWAWWGVPFLGHYRYLVMEFGHGASSYFGRQPLIFYFKAYVLMLGAAVPVAAFLAYRGARHLPVVFWTTVAVIVPFHFFGHKEYRFIVSAVPLAVLLVTMGAVELVVASAGRVTWRTGGLVLAGWLAAMIAVCAGDQYRPYWFQDRNHILAFREIGARPDACGVALVGIRWYHTPGYSGLGRDIPIYESGRDEQEMSRIIPAANYVLAGPKSPEPPAPYRLLKAYDRPVEFLYGRPGGCARDEPAIVRLPPFPR